jgi:hypothetical protein
MRMVRSLERLHEWQAARDLCLVAVANSENEAERQQVRRVLPRLNRKLQVASALAPRARGRRYVSRDRPRTPAASRAVVNHCQ